MSAQSGLDRNGKVVVIGDRVRLLAVRPSIFNRLSAPEYSGVSAMLGQVVEVFDVYETGQVWASAYSPRSDGMTELHAISVEPEAIEL